MIIFDMSCSVYPDGKTKHYQNTDSQNTGEAQHYQNQNKQNNGEAKHYHTPDKQNNGETKHIFLCHRCCGLFIRHMLLF
jgi:hypothetical protein